MLEEVLFLAEALVPSARAVVGRGGGCWAEEERFLFDALGELLGGSVGGVGACEEDVGDVAGRSGRGGHFGGI